MAFGAIEHWEVWRLFTSRMFYCGLGGWIVASMLKMALAWRKSRKMDFAYLFATGGMPSSHAAAATGVMFGIGYTTGFDSPITVLAAAVAVITMFDSVTIRRAAGEHAKWLNEIVRDIRELNFQPKRRLRELRGHTRKEALCGMLVGIAWATALCLAWD